MGEISRGDNISTKIKSSRVKIEIGEASSTFWKIEIGEASLTFWKIESKIGEASPIDLAHICHGVKVRNEWLRSAKCTLLCVRQCPKRFMQLLTTKIYLLRWSFKKLWIWFFSIKIARIWIIRYSNEICHLIFDVNDDFQICNQRKVVRGKRETRQKIDSNFGFWRRLEDSLDPKTILWCKNVVERFFAFVVAAKFPACVHVGIVSWR